MSGWVLVLAAGGAGANPCGWALGLSPVRMPRLVRAKMACGHRCHFFRLAPLASGKNSSCLSAVSVPGSRIPLLWPGIPARSGAKSARTMPAGAAVFVSRELTRHMKQNVTSGWLRQRQHPSPGRAHRLRSRSSGYGDHVPARIA